MEGRLGTGSVVFEEGACGLCGFTCDLNCKWVHIIRRSLSFAQTDGCLLRLGIPWEGLLWSASLASGSLWPCVSFSLLGLFVMVMEKFDLQLQSERCMSTCLLALL